MLCSALALITLRQVPPPADFQQVASEWTILAPAHDPPPGYDPVFAERIMTPARPGAPVIGSAPDAALPARVWRTIEKSWGGVREPIDYAYSVLELPHEAVLFVALQGAQVLYVNGTPYAGDPASKGGWGVPAFFQKGANELLVHGSPNGFSLALWRPRGRLVIDTWSHEPPVLDADDEAWLLAFGPTLRVNVFNASTKPVEELHFHYNDFFAPGTRPTWPKEEWRDGGRIPPGGLLTRDPWPSSDEATTRACARLGRALCPVAFWEFESKDYVEAILELPVAPGGGRVAPTSPAAEKAHSTARRLASHDIIYGTLEDGEQQLALARLVQQMRAVEGGFVGEVLPDSAFGEGGSESYTVIGNADTVSGWSKLVPPALGLIADRQRLVRAGERPIEFEGVDAALEATLVEQRGGRQRRISVLAHTGEHGARLAWKLVLDAGGPERALEFAQLKKRE